jgi:hypothetical protein
MAGNIINYWQEDITDQYVFASALRNERSELPSGTLNRAQSHFVNVH